MTKDKLWLAVGLGLGTFGLAMIVIAIAPFLGGKGMI